MNPVIELDGLRVRFGSRDILKGLKATLTGRSIGLLCGEFHSHLFKFAEIV